MSVSPFFAFNAASYFSHTWCGVLLLGAACLAARADRSPRFHYEASHFVVPFVAANLFRTETLAGAVSRGRLNVGAVIASVALMPAGFAAHAVIEREVVRERMDPFADSRAAGLKNALVLIGGRVGTDRSMAAQDLTRNGIDYAGSVLFGVDPGEAARCTPAARLRGRTTYLYAWNDGIEDGGLRPLSCPAPPAPRPPPKGGAFGATARGVAPLEVRSERGGTAAAGWPGSKTPDAETNVPKCLDRRPRTRRVRVRDRSEVGNRPCGGDLAHR